MDYIVNTPCGMLQGTAGRVPGTAAYKGIRYATAGRWEVPVQVTHWEGVYDATEYGANAYQSTAFSAPSPNNFYHKEFREGIDYTYSEDCLSLNVFTRDTAKEGEKLPVIVYIHGGAFQGGSGNQKQFSEPVWPAQGVVGVTIHYRLGPLGFACLPELKEEAGFTGNYGLYDQLTAISWVKDNIASFGGDPENITIMGQSAGAESVQQLCLSPLSKGLFQKAVMSSAGGVFSAKKRYLNPHRAKAFRFLKKARPGTCNIMTSLPAEHYYPLWQAVMEKAGCQTLAELRAITPEALFKAFNEVKKSFPEMGAYPCIDGKLIVAPGAEILAAGKQMQIPYLIGSTSEDMIPAILQDIAKMWCAPQPKPSYIWYFDRQLPGDDKGAWHSADLWYWFGTLENCWRPMTKKDYALSDQMVKYLCNFAYTGDPNGFDLPAWIPSNKRQNWVLWLGEQDTHMEKPPMKKLRRAMYGSEHSQQG